MGPNLEARASIQHHFISPTKAKVPAIINFNTAKGLLRSKQESFHHFKVWPCPFGSQERQDYRGDMWRRQRGDSYVRTYFSDNSSFVSKEWPIVGFDKSLSPFSAKGDLGSLVEDAEGWIGGMLTGGSGYLGQMDVSYATPMVALLQDMHKHGWKRPNPDVAP